MGLGSFFLEIGVDQSALQRGLNTAESKITAFGGKLERLGTGLSLAVSAPLGLLARKSIIAFGELEALKMSLGTLDKTADSLNKRLTELNKVAELPGLGFKEAIQADVRLRSVGISADISKRAMLAFGNAIATAGGGKAQFDSVIYQLSQMSAKSKVLSQDFRPIIEAVPMVSAAVKKLYGTVDTEQIQSQMSKAGINSAQFINQLITELEKLPKVSGGVKNALENLEDTFFKAFAKVGETIDKNVGIQKWVEQIGKSTEELANYFAGLTPEAQKAVLAIAGIAVVLPPLLALAGTVLPAIGAGFLALTGPAGIAAAALVAAAVLVVSNWDKVSSSIYRAQSRLQKGMFELGMAGADIQQQFDPKGANEMRASLFKSYALNKAEDPEVKRFAEQAKKDYQANKKFNYKRGEKPKVEVTPPPAPNGGLNLATDAQIAAAKKIAEETLALRKDLQSQTRDLIIASMEDETHRAKSQAQKRAEDEIATMREKMIGLKNLETEFADWRKQREQALANEIIKIQRESFKVPNEIKRQMITDVMNSIEPKDKKKLTSDIMQNKLDRNIMLGTKDIQSESDRTSVGKALGMEIDIEKWKTDSASYIEAAEGMVQANARIKNSTAEIALAAGLAMGETVAQMMMGTATITDLANSLLSSVGQIFADMLKQMAIAEAKALGLKALLGDPTALVRVIGLAAAGGLVGAFSNKVGQGRATNQQQRATSTGYGTVLRGSEILASQQRYETIKAF